MADSSGRMLCVDLSSARWTTEQLKTEDVRNWLSGRAMNVALLSQTSESRINPLGPENPLFFSCGLLVGSPAPSASRLHINAISPLTGLLGSSNIGGRIAQRLHACGYDTIRIQGTSRVPVFIDIDEHGCRILSAESLWGLSTHDTHRQLTTMLETDAIETLVIGTAGENLNRFACIVTDHDHAAGRTGLGAVMGSKHLKAIVIRRPEKRQPRRFGKPAGTVVKDYFKRIISSPDFTEFSTHGGAGYVKWADDRALMSTRNYRANRFDGAGNMDGRQMQPALSRSRGCTGCPVKCKAVLAFKTGRLKGREAFRPEFEPMINLGAKCGLADMQDVVFLDNLCTELGLDSTSASTAIAFAMDIFQRGLLHHPMAEGLDLSWGNSAAMERLIRQMAAMEGLGGLLGMGVRSASQLLGPETEPYAAHVKGLELTAYHPASLLGSALGYAVSSRGGDYNNVYASLEHRWTPEQAEKAFGTAKALDPKSYEGKGRLIHRAVLVNIIVDSLGICKVPVLSMLGTFDLEPEAALTAAVTGWDLTADNLFGIGERTALLERIINLRQGLTDSDDTLPEMFFNPGPNAIDRDGFAAMIAEFYDASGLDKSGRPSDIKREEVEALLPNPITETT